MEKKGIEEKMEVANSTEKAVDLHQEEEEDDEEEEALSLCDLPTNHNSIKEKSDEEKSTSNIPPRVIEIQQDFDFCSVSREFSEICAADEVFFQGQILPLRDSVSSEKGLLHYCGSGSISRSESMDYNSSSRSSSIGSSGSSSLQKPRRHKPPPNHFHSHPSPSPRLKSSNRHGIVNSSNNRNCTKKTSWNIFRLGLVTAPPEIAFQDLKTRCNNNTTTNCKNFGSRNSTGSNTSSSSSSGNKKIRPDKKRSFLSGCKCTNDAVDTVLGCKITQIKKSASESEIEAPRIEEANENVEPMKPQEQQGAKKQLSRHRTFEWLKQLSIEVPSQQMKLDSLPA